MRRVTLLLSLCALLLSGLIAGVQAQQINIANDVNGGNVVDISLRDADLATVLAALFNTTGGKFQVRLGNGINGRIGRLVLTQMPFDKALDAILGTDYSYTKQVQSDGIALYTITGRQGSGGTLFTPKPPTFQAPAIGIPTFATDAATPPPFGGGGATPASPLLNLGARVAAGSSATTTTAGDDAAEEATVVKLLRVNNLDVRALAEALGGSYIDLFELMNMNNGNSTLGGGSGIGSNRGSGSNYNNNGNNNNNNSYNNNNNNNNRNNNNYNNNNNNNRNNNNYNNNNTNNSFNPLSH